MDWSMKYKITHYLIKNLKIFFLFSSFFKIYLNFTSQNSKFTKLKIHGGFCHPKQQTKIQTKNVRKDATLISSQRFSSSNQSRVFNVRFRCDQRPRFHQGACMVSTLKHSIATKSNFSLVLKGLHRL